MANPRRRRIRRYARNARKSAAKLVQQLQMGNISRTEYLDRVRSPKTLREKLLHNEAVQRLNEAKKVVEKPAARPPKKAPPATGLTRVQKREREAFRRERQRAAAPPKNFSE